MQILLVNRWYLLDICDYASPEEQLNAFVDNGNNETTVALLDPDITGRKVIEFLKNFSLKVVVFDSFYLRNRPVYLSLKNFL